MTPSKSWLYGLRLESSTLVKQIFKSIHNRDLNTARAKQIVASYLQGKEYYKNAEKADISVKPLLLFYGVSSLSRCITLLLNPFKGEEALKKGHGLTTENWANILSSNVEDGLLKIGDLKVTSCNGLFWDLINATNNISYLHVRSSGVDFSVLNEAPTLNASLKFEDVTARVPDLRSEYELWTGKESDNTPVNSLITKGNRFEMKLLDNSKIDSIFSTKKGVLTFENQGNLKVIKGDFEHMPMLINTFVNKTFDSIPSLFVAKVLDGFGEIAQIPLTYVHSYFLGMLCRYFPSHWMALTRGNIGDSVWPLIQSSMNYVEKSYPELIMEYIQEVTKQGIERSNITED